MVRLAQVQVAGLSAVIGLGSTQEYPDVTGGLGVAALALNNRQPSW